MSEMKDMFTQWEKDINPEHNGIIIAEDILDVAQTLQLGMLDAHPGQRFHMGMMALEILSQHPNPLKHGDFVIRSEKAYLTIHENSDTRDGYAFRYGGMKLAGRVGHYALDCIEDEWTLALQVFEPTQIEVDSSRDRIFGRLPAPLMLPAVAIKPPLIRYK